MTRKDRMSLSAREDTTDWLRYLATAIACLSLAAMGF